ncbi:sensor histidine kinase [Hymenobacter actinosclerus]|uniref:Histidine kinase n=1 Tax=Hymenobacter actinosclerus TaxID=82805 RepID=A0A1I0D9G6_9BACT|nr:sensor histidine kinase [Hymenobacter actinosclerus]SET28930.1 Histidine kinase [Hymenobacter actinosclerus]
MQTRDTNFKPFLYHLTAWAVFILYEVLIGVAISPASVSLLETGMGFCINAMLFYANCLVLMPWLFARRRYLLYFLSLLGLLACFIMLRHILKVGLFPLLSIPSINPVISLQVFIAESLYRGMYFLLPSIGYWFVGNTIQLEKQKLEREHELRVAEKSLMEANISFLKNQINPHFLFNSLNFLYAQVYPHSEKSAKGILLLSDIMRYALKEGDDHGKVMLEQEIQHLHNYIDINQLRFNNLLQVQFEVSGSLQFTMILPLVLITFVENCFKHGDLSDPHNPLKIQLRVMNNELTFYTHNMKRNGPKEKSMGIGLANTKQRLSLTYPKRHTLTILDERDYYCCHLTIAL